MRKDTNINCQNTFLEITMFKYKSRIIFLVNIILFTGCTNIEIQNQQLFLNVYNGNSTTIINSSKLQYNIKSGDTIHLSAVIVDKSGEPIPDYQQNSISGMDFHWKILNNSKIGNISDSLGQTIDFIGHEQYVSAFIKICYSDNNRYLLDTIGFYITPKDTQINDSTLTLTNYFKYNNLLFKSTITHKKNSKYAFCNGNNFYTKFYYPNGNKWLEFIVEPYFEIDYCTERIAGPVYEWDTSGNLINIGQENISIANDWYSYSYGDSKGVSTIAGLCGSVLCKYVIDPDTTVTINSFGDVGLDIDTIYKVGDYFAMVWQKADSGWVRVYHINKDMGAPMVRIYQDIVEKYYIEINSFVRKIPPPNGNSTPMVTVYGYGY
jgi:hypothetical protein